MAVDPFAVIFKFFILSIFVPGLVLSVVFTFAINVFLEWEQKFEDVDALSRRIINPFHRQVHWWEEWLVVNHSFFGLCFMLCILWEIITLFTLADAF